jgi:flagellar hook-length control protein FliK
MNAIAAALSPMVNPSAAADAARGDDARSGEFARCLDQAREGEDCAVNDADEAPPRPLAKARSGRENMAPRKAEANPAKNVASGKEAGAASATETDTLPTTETQADEAAAPDLAALLPGWSSAATVAPAPVSTANAGEDIDASPDITTTFARGGAAPLAPRADVIAPAVDEPPARRATAIDDSATSAAAAAGASLPVAASETKDALPLSPQPTASAFATTMAAASARNAAETLPAATLQAPIDAPAFAPSLATQVRWWANDGVQQAQLLLNPAEMGPVAVKIVLDGREARIDFSADHAATRNAIEAALPVLAAALDDGGLKLCGGGVHDGSAQRQNDWHARSVTDRTARASAAEQGHAPAVAAPRNASAGRGLVDLVA